jgi:hypothetical protein
MGITWKIAAGVASLGLVSIMLYHAMVGAEIVGLLYDIVRTIFPVFPQR